MDLVVLLIYVGGAMYDDAKGRGFWASIFWPYHLGRYLAALSSEQEGRE